MQTVTIEKSKLKQIVAQNRKKHEDLYKEAKGDYEKQVADAYKKIAKKSSSKKGLALHDARDILANIVQPQSHTSDYDRVLGMIDLEVNDQIELSAEDYARYVEDKWEWRTRFDAQYLSATGKFAV